MNTFTNLRELELTKVQFKRSSFGLSGASKELIDVISKNSNITSLVLKSFSMDNELLSIIAESLNLNLKKFDIFDSFLSNGNKGFTEICQKCTNLEYLNLDNVLYSTGPIDESSLLHLGKIIIDVLIIN